MSAAKARKRALGAVLSVLAALWGGASWAQQQPEAKSETERLLSQKALMLEAYLGSKKIADALLAGEPRNVEVVERARAELAEGAKSLEKGDLKRAEQSLNAGLRLAVKRLWDKPVTVEQLRVKASTGDAWLMRHGSRTPAVHVTAPLVITSPTVFVVYSSAPVTMRKSSMLSLPSVLQPMRMSSMSRS